MFSESDIRKCVERATCNQDLDQWTRSTCVSCWVTELRDESAMWNVHGKAGAAIRISVNADRFCAYIEEQCYGLAFGPVTYEGMTSMVRPQFLARRGFTEAEDSIHHFFFHKRGCYEWEQEFRVILASSGPVRVPLKDEMIQSVVISPVQKPDSKIETLIRQRFGDRVRG
jgi:hypothetical protein